MAAAHSIAQRGIARQGVDAGSFTVVVLFLAAVCTPLFFTLGSMLMSPLRLFLLLSIVPLSMKMLTDRDLKINAVDVLLAGYVIWSILAIGPRHPHRIVEWGGSLVLEVIGAYLVARVCIRDRESFIAMAKLIGLVVAATLPLAISESQTGIPVIPDFLTGTFGLDSVTDKDIDKRLGMERAQVILAHPIHYGVWCSVAFSMTWVALEGEISPVRRVVVSAAVFACCFLALSSGAFLAVLMQIGLIGWYTILRRNPRKWTILFALVITAYIAIDIVSESSPVRVFMRYATYSQHNAYWRATIFEWGMHNVWSSPVFGIGLSDWVRPAWMRSASMDNYWLVHALRAGIPAFAFIAGAFLLMLWRLSRRDFSGDPQINRLRRAYIFTIVGLMFSLATVHVWTNVQAYVMFFLGSGAWMLTATPRDGSQGEGPAPAPRGRGTAGPRYTRFPTSGPASGAAPGAALGTTPGAFARERAGGGGRTRQAAVVSPDRA